MIMEPYSRTSARSHGFMPSMWFIIATQLLPESSSQRLTIILPMQFVPREPARNHGKAAAQLYSRLSCGPNSKLYKARAAEKRGPAGEPSGGLVMLPPDGFFVRQKLKKSRSTLSYDWRANISYCRPVRFMRHSDS